MKEKNTGKTKFYILYPVQAANKLGIDVTFLNVLHNHGYLKMYLQGGGQIYYDTEDVDEIKPDIKYILSTCFQTALIKADRERRQSLKNNFRENNEDKKI